MQANVQADITWLFFFAKKNVGITPMHKDVSDLLENVATLAFS